MDTPRHRWYKSNMVSRDYTKELGLKPSAPRIPLPVGIAILVVAGAAVWFAVTKLNQLPSGTPATAETSATPAAKPGTAPAATGH